jgi:hypothetical protein
LELEELELRLEELELRVEELRELRGITLSFG